MDRDETGECILTLRCAAGSVADMVGILVSPDPRLEVRQGAGSFGSLGLGDTARNAGTRFVLHATSMAPIEDPIWCDLYLTGGGGFCETLAVPVVVGDSITEPLGPDAYGYRAFDDQDLWYPEHPSYDWVEIRPVGTRVVLGDDATRVIDLPPEFGPIYYYGQRTTRLSICSNGWVAPDTSTRLDFNNIWLPEAYAPQRIVAVLWDNFDPGAYGWVGYYHDAANHRFIVTYDSVPYFPLYNQWERFQVIFYDTTLAGPSGDNVIVMQYATARNVGSVTCGMQNHERNSGLTYFWNSGYPRTSVPIEPGRAVKYVADVPTAVRESPAEKPGGSRLNLVCSPNPARDRVELAFELPERGLVRAGVFDAAGRMVAELGHGLRPAGHNALHWDCTRVPEGVYFCRVVSSAGEARQKLVIAR